MDYTEIVFRLKEIKREIYELNHQPIWEIQEKIEALKKINLLLREQNHLLEARQNLLAFQRNLIHAA